jgi:hypothetical protein
MAVCYQWAPMLTRKSVTALVCALALGAPTAAFAQSAGDNQYFDPVGPDSGGSTGGGSTPSSGGSTPSTPTAPQPATGTSSSTPAPTSSTAAASAPQEGTAAAPGELPRTGGDPLMFALLGTAMLLTGAGARLLVVRDPH